MTPERTVPNALMQEIDEHPELLRPVDAALAERMRCLVGETGDRPRLFALGGDVRSQPFFATGSGARDFGAEFQAQRLDDFHHRGKLGVSLG